MHVRKVCRPEAREGGWVVGTHHPELRFRVPGGKRLEVGAGLLLWSLLALACTFLGPAPWTPTHLLKEGRKVEGGGSLYLAPRVGDSSRFITRESV